MFPFKHGIFTLKFDKIAADKITTSELSLSFKDSILIQEQITKD